MSAAKPDEPQSRGFVFAHLTDAHLPSHGGFAPRELLNKRALSALNWLRSRRRLHVRAVADALAADVRAHAPDHVAMTGDVTNFGLPREFEAGAEWLGALGPSVSFVPGNHDAMVAGVETARDAVFAPFTEGGAFPYVARRGPVAFIGVSTAVPTPAGLAQGRVGAEQTERMAEALRTEQGRVRVLLIHHPPTDVTKPRRALTDRAEVAAAIAEAGCELVLHGHDHKNELSWIDAACGRRIPVLGAPSASTPAGARKEAAEWRLIETPGPRGALFDVRRRRIGADGAFEDAGRFLLPGPS
ncbi:MAG: metallophosphoesterase [Pseudomonadota bacterium]